MTPIKMRWLPVAPLCLVLWPGAVWAQSETLMTAYRQGAALKKAGRYAKAIPFWRRALRWCESLPCQGAMVVLAGSPAISRTSLGTR